MKRAARRAVVVGVASSLGGGIARALARHGLDVVGTARRPVEADGWRESRTLDLSIPDDAPSLFAEADLAILTPGLALSRNALPALIAAGVKKAVFISSNNVAVTPHDPVYESILAAERDVAASGLAFAILRPTLIYGRAEPTDGFARLLRLMDRWPLAPLAGSGDALQQPIHVDDLARIVVEVALDDAYDGATLALGGPDIAPMREIYKALTAALGVWRPILPLATTPLRPVVRLALRFGLRLPVTDAQLKRANLDKQACPVVGMRAPPLARIRLKDGLDRQIRLMRGLGHLRIR